MNCTANGRERFSIEGVSGGKLARGGWAQGWAHLKRADCSRTARLIIEIILEIQKKLGVAGGQT